MSIDGMFSRSFMHALHGVTSTAQWVRALWVCRPGLDIFHRMLLLLLCGVSDNRRVLDQHSGSMFHIHLENKARFQVVIINAIRDPKHSLRI